MDTRGRGRPKKVTFIHKVRLSEDEGRETKVMGLIKNLERLRSEYGESCVDTLLQKLLLSMTYEDMVVEISGRGGVLVDSIPRTIQGNEFLSQTDPEEFEVSVSDAFNIGES